MFYMLKILSKLFVYVVINQSPVRLISIF